jgi:spermidine/putrescine transport system permease protein
MAFGAFGGTATAVAEPAVRKRSKVALILLLPGILYLGLFFLAPLFSLVLTSFQAPVEFGDIGQYQTAFKWENYTTVISTYGEHIIRSFIFAAVATVLALLFSFPIAYFIGVTLRRFPLVQALALTLVIAPFFISFLLRTLAWKQLLSDESPFVSFLNTIQLLPEGAHVTGTAFSVIFGLTYNFIPFMTLPIYTSLEKLDLRYVEAGGDLYASPASTFFRVTVPLAAPGIISGMLLTFIPAAGDYINASRDFLGSTDTAMIGNVIEANFLVLQNYPTAAALSLVLMAAILIFVSIYVKKSGTDDLI